MAADRTKFILDEDRIPRSWYNIAADLPTPPPPVLHPGTGQPIGPADLAPLFPMELIKQVVSQDREIEIPEPVRDAYALYRPSPLYPRASAGEGARYAGPHLLQVRGRQPVRQPQAQHRARAGLLQQGGGRHPPRDRDRRRAVGQRAGLRRRPSSASRSRSSWSAASYDQKPYRRVLMETYGAEVVASPSPDTQYGRSVLAEDAGPHRLARHRDQRGDRGHRHPPGHEVLARVGLRLRPPPPDGHRPGGDRADGAGRRGAGRRHRLRRRWLELRRPDLPVHRPRAARRARSRGSSPSSRRRRRR